MNQNERFVYGIYQIAMVIRETLECFLLDEKQRKDKAVVQRYKERRALLELCLKSNSPFMNFCYSNLRNGQVTNIEEHINQFNQHFYSKNADFLFVLKCLEKETLIVNSDKKVEMLDYIVGLWETMHDVLEGFKNTLTKSESLEPEFDQLLQLENSLYRLQALRSLSAVFVPLFEEFNQAATLYCKNHPSLSKEEAKNSPIAKDVEAKINRVGEFMYFVKRKSDDKDQELQKVMEKYFRCLGVFYGKEKYNSIRFDGFHPYAKDMKDFEEKFMMLTNAYIIPLEKKYEKKRKKIEDSVVIFDKKEARMKF